jgi:hypothetical protein
VVVALCSGRRSQRFLLRRAVVVDEMVAPRIEPIVVRRVATDLGWGRHDRERGGTSGLAGPEDAAVERAEADPLTAERESLPEYVDRHQVVEAARQGSDVLHRSAAELHVPIISHRARSIAYARRVDNPS